MELYIQLEDHCTGAKWTGTKEIIFNEFKPLHINLYLHSVGLKASDKALPGIQDAAIELFQVHGAQ